MTEPNRVEPDERRPPAARDVGDAAWAHNRWPTIGLYAGAGLGVMLGVITVAGWLWTLVYAAALAAGGCFVGLAAAKIVYRQADRAKNE